MLKEVEQPATLEPTDLLHAAFADAVARNLGAGDIMEYWKSTPYLLNFLKHYELRRRLDAVASRPSDDLLAVLRGPNGHLLRKRTIESYARLDPGNARMRALMRDTIDSGLWRMLWMPPSMPYSALSGAFEGMEHATKSLVFSAWTAVPDAIAAICSFEAERLMIGEADLRHSQLYDRVKPLLRFARASTDNRLTGMPVLTWMMPSPTLAAAVDPLRVAIGHGLGLPVSGDTMLREAKTACHQLLAKLPPGAPGSRPDERWYWASIALLERTSGLPLWCQSADGWVTASPDHESGTRFREHVEQLALVMDEGLDLGPRPEDLSDIMAQLALAGPGTCALRALARIAPGLALDDPAMLSAAAKIAAGFRSLFNMPETIAMLKGAGEDSYWRLALRYAMDGNLQAMLDEHMHVLLESLGLKTHEAARAVEQVSSHLQTTLSLRTAQVRVDELNVSSNEIKVTDFNTRTRFALRFADIRDDNDQAIVRADAVRDTFNSPFRPFILASTSIGQEGLDFHTWCHAVVHWNLPSNPVDLEQREGRVHRYKGHAVRKNIAERYGLPALQEWDGEGDPWTYMFERAEDDRPPGLSDLVPYWVFEDGQARVERRVPLLPFSREIGKLRTLKHGLALYRLVFGQPRQEDMMAYLSKSAAVESGREEDWLISLVPPVDGAAAAQSQGAVAPGDWKTLPMPASVRRVPVGLQFNEDEMACIRYGVLPQQMEDKWFIFFQDGVLHMHRSWTGNCIYQVRFARVDGLWHAIDAKVNGDHEQYSPGTDEHERAAIGALIDIVLLRRDGQYPVESVSPGAAALQQWSVLGRAMLPRTESAEEELRGE